MIDDGPQFSWLIAFLAVVRCNGYQAAAKFLDVPQPTISKRVAKFEAWMGEELLTKNRPPTVTRVGVRTCDAVVSFIKVLYIERGGFDPIFDKGKREPSQEESAILRLLYSPATLAYWETNVRRVPKGEWQGKGQQIASDPSDSG